MMYKSCYDLPMGRFITCLVDKDYTGLSIEGEHSQEEMYERWEQIYEQYAAMAGVSMYSEYIAKMKDYGRSLLQLHILTASITALSYAYYPEVVAALNKSGFKCKFDEYDLEAYAKELDSLSKRAQSLSVRLKLSMKNIEEMTKKTSKNTVNRGDFVTTVGILSKYMGFRIDVDLVTVAEFVGYQKMFDQEQKRMINTK